MKTPPGVKAMEVAGVHNLFQVGANYFSGSTPEGEEGFAALAKLGVKTMISVDGAQPEVELARKQGIRYVHLPQGYDGISTNLQTQLIKVARSLPGRIYVHCHHGKHRGPAAVAVICRSELGWSAEEAREWLVAAGTATNYAGLYAVAKNFQKPPVELLSKVSTDFPERANVSGLIEAMVGIDERWEHLKAVRAAGYKTPKENPDIVPVNEALLLWEHYREAQRLSESMEHGKKFVEGLARAEAEVKTGEKLLREFLANPTPARQLQLDKSFDGIARSCSACHKEFRDRAGIKSAVQ